MDAKKEKPLFERVVESAVFEKYKTIGSISAGFTEVSEGVLKEYFEPSAIREVRHEDVSSQHFTDWFFRMDDFINIKPSEFPLEMITHSDEIYVYGYFSDDKLNGLICVDEYLDCYKLSFFFVNPAFQYQGIGQYLFQWILKRFKDNSRAIHIYRKYGFDIVKTAYGRGYTPDNPYYVMQKNV